MKWDAMECLQYIKGKLLGITIIIIGVLSIVLYEKSEINYLANRVLIAEGNHSSASTEPSGKIKIPALINKAKIAEAEHRLILPESNNAYDLYRQVLTLDPYNTQAKQGINKIEKYYVGNIETALEKNKLDDAKKYMDLSYKLNPYNQGLQDLSIKYEKKIRMLSTSYKTPRFPWPPPKASATVIVPNKDFYRGSNEKITLKDIDLRITKALDESGYFENSYYEVPGGFALVTRLESINPDGTSKDDAERWETEVGPLDKFSLAAYIKALFTSNPGYFRIIVFVVTPFSFSQSTETVTRHKAMEWLPSGLNKLPEPIGEVTYTKQYSCTALIYEFEKDRGEKTATTLVPGRLSGKTHLVKSDLWKGLQ